MMFKKQSGFSLLEIMVAAALLGGLALAGAKLMENQTKSMKTVEVRSEYNAVVADIRSILAIEDSCMATVGPSANATNTVLNDIKQKPAYVTTPVTKYVANSNWKLAPAYGNGNVRIISLRLGEASLGPLNPTSNTKIGTTNLIIRLQTGQNKTVGADVLDRRIPINVETNAGDVILKCSSAGTTGLDNRYLIRAEGGDVWGPINMRNESPIIGPASFITMTPGTAIIVQEGAFIDFTSDRKLKKDIQELTSMNSKIRKLNPVRYKWKSNEAVAYGVIAQELKQIFPELVHNNGPNGTLTVDYIQLTPILLRGIQELDEENQKLKKSLSTIEGDIEEMKILFCRQSRDEKFCAKMKR
ncbi:tail fiber domain-containing protein [Peredibacter sp. HCB2-198]|uniref:tail fiber domain-containing protein n=1 Tax=Peredibacter sp. HCB2-198 TaxID=3383025 RepID=UPI0038B537A5